MSLTLDEINENLSKLDALLEPRLKNEPNYNIYVYSKMQTNYIRELLAKNGTITEEDIKNINIGTMSIKENLRNVDRELSNQIHALTGSIRRYVESN